jgi:hypothetical protein
MQGTESRLYTVSRYARDCAVKLSDFVFRDLNVFVETFVPPENVESVKSLTKELDVFKWGVGEPGPSGIIVICCDQVGDIRRTRQTLPLSETWILFFTFHASLEKETTAVLNYGCVIDAWSSGESNSRFSGFDVAFRQSELLLELINTASKT